MSSSCSATALTSRRLAWRKTEHHYPLTAAGHARPRLGEVLVEKKLKAEDSELRGYAAVALGCVALDVNHKLLSTDIVGLAHGAGCRVLCYTPNDPERIRVLADWGVDAIITDAVDQVAPDSLPPALPLPP